MFTKEEATPNRSTASFANASRRRRDRLAALQTTINAQERDERQRAVRALLSQPLLSPDGPTSEAFTLVQKHRDWLRPWFAHHAGWQLMLDSEAARLIKRPAKLNDATRPCREPNSGVPLSRRAYVILCLALASLVRADRQTTLVRLRDSIIGLVRAEPRFEAAGVRVELEHQESRRDFVHAIRLLLAWGVLKRVQGEEECFIKDADVDALYNVHRPVLARLLAASMARRSGCVVKWFLAGTGLHHQHNRLNASVPCCLQELCPRDAGWLRTRPGCRVGRGSVSSDCLRYPKGACPRHPSTVTLPLPSLCRLLTLRASANTSWAASRSLCDSRRCKRNSLSLDTKCEESRRSHSRRRKRGRCCSDRRGKSRLALSSTCPSTT